MRQLKTGIPGLDEIIGGGVPERNVVVVEGGPGTGKTLLSLQFLLFGINNGENGVFVMTDDFPSRLQSFVEVLGWNLKDKLIIIDSFSSYFGKVQGEYVVRDTGDINELIDVIVKAVKNVSAKRVVIDNFNSLCFGKPVSPRAIFLNIKRLLQNLNCTSLIVVNRGDENIEHMADGLIKLSIDENEGKRTISVIKMRGTSVKLGKYSLDINENGLSVRV